MTELPKTIFWILLALLVAGIKSDLQEDGQCTYNITEDKAIDLISSKALGGFVELLNTTDVATLEECYQSCCEDVLCTTITYEPGDDTNNCYKILCDPPENCILRDKNGITSVIVTHDEVKEEGMVSDDDEDEVAEIGFTSTPIPEKTTVSMTTVMQESATSVLSTEGGEEETESEGIGTSRTMHASTSMPVTSTQSVVGGGSTQVVSNGQQPTTSTESANETMTEVVQNATRGVTPTVRTTGTSVANVFTTRTVTYKTDHNATSGQSTSHSEPSSVSTPPDINITTANTVTSEQGNPAVLQNISTTTSQSVDSTTPSQSVDKSTVTPTVTTSKTTSEAVTTEVNEEGGSVTPGEQATTQATPQPEGQTNAEVEITTEPSQTTAESEQIATEIHPSTELDEYPEYNETRGSFGHMMASQTTTGALVAAMCFGILFVFAIGVLLGKRVYDGYQRRHYSKMDYLINGMYN